MCQPRGAVAGGMVLDLDNSSVMAVECEDRRYCFQITSPTGKTYGDKLSVCLCVCACIKSCNMLRGTPVKVLLGSVRACLAIEFTAQPSL